MQKQIAYCGLYCNLCSARNRITKQASSLRETMKNEDSGGTLRRRQTNSERVDPNG